MSRYQKTFGGYKLYVGGLGTSVDRRDIKEAFDKYGHITDVWIPNKRSGFGFVSFAERRDAEDAIRGMNGRLVLGSRLIVEASQQMRGDFRSRRRSRSSSPRRRSRSWSPRRRSRSRSYRDISYSRSRTRSRSRYRSSKKKKYRNRSTSLEYPRRRRRRSS